MRSGKRPVSAGIFLADTRELGDQVLGVGLDPRDRGEQVVLQAEVGKEDAHGRLGLQPLRGRFSATTLAGPRSPQV